jgi:hypothetical protein
MRIERSVTTVSWIPSDMLEGMGKLATRMKLAHHDPPPPDSLGDSVPDALEQLRVTDRFRFANHLRAYVDVDDSGTVTGYGHLGSGQIGATTIGNGTASITIPAVQLDDIQRPPEVLSDGSIAFVQTVGGRTGAPMPRTVSRPPFVQYHAPIVWTTLQLVIRPDGTHVADLIGASGFPRHWVYDDTGALAAKSSLADYATWMAESFGRATPWGDEDSPALVTQVETALEKELQAVIMHGETAPDVTAIRAGDVLFEQGDVGDGRLYLLLNGVLVVEVDGEAVAEIGPGAVFGERAELDDGRRTATLRATTDCKFAAAPLSSVHTDRLGALAAGHRREER